MTKKNSEDKFELQIHCPFYKESLEECPSSSSILSDEDLKTLLKHCTTEKYTNCKLYTVIKEKSQAA